MIQLSEKEQLGKIERALLEKHPNWPQAKARWLAMQALNMIPWR